MRIEILRQGLAISFLVTLLTGCETNTTNPPSSIPSTPSGNNEAVLPEIADLTSQILDASRALINLDAATASQSSAADRLKALIKSRAEVLSRKSQTQPTQVIHSAMTAEQKSRIPSWAQACLERTVEESGDVEVLAIDNEEAPQTTVSMTSDSGNRYELHFGANAPELQTGAKIKVRGLHIPCGPGVTESGTETSTDDAHSSGCRTETDGGCSADAIAVESGERDLATTEAAAAHPSIGEQSTIVILLNFSNKVNTLTKDKVNDLVFNQGSEYLREASLKQTWLRGEVYGPYTIASSSSSCSSSTIETQAKAAASAAGVSLTGYKRFMYVFPYTTACGWSGLGTIGGAPSKSWINGVTVLRTYVHELGHNFGLYHSNALNCGTSASIGSGCSVVEYGDTSDVMGKTTAHYNAYQKERITWLGTSTSAPITTVQTSGTYSIEPYSAYSFNPKALKILKSVNSSTGAKTYYYVEFRQPIGFDAIFTSSSTSSNNLTRSVVVHTGNDSAGKEIYEINMNPASSFYQAGLNVGQRYEDPTAGVAIQLVSQSTAGAFINVIVPGSTPVCTHANPTVSIAQTQTSSVQAGTPVNYTITVRNNDSAGCSTSDFNLLANLPASSWTGTFNSDRLTGLTPGASASTSLQVTSPVGTTAAGYPFSVEASNGSTAGYEASASSTYTVGTTTSTLVSLTTNKTVYTQGNYIYMTITGEVGGSYQLRINRPDGTSSLRTGTIGSTGKVNYTFTTYYALRGTYTAQVTVTKLGTSASATRSYSIQ